MSDAPTAIPSPDATGGQRLAAALRGRCLMAGVPTPGRTAPPARRPPGRRPLPRQPAAPGAGAEEPRPRLRLAHRTTAWPRRAWPGPRATRGAPGAPGARRLPAPRALLPRGHAHDHVHRCVPGAAPDLRAAGACRRATRGARGGRRRPALRRAPLRLDGAARALRRGARRAARPDAPGDAREPRPARLVLAPAGGRRPGDHGPRARAAAARGAHPRRRHRGPRGRPRPRRHGAPDGAVRGAGLATGGTGAGGHRGGRARLGGGGTADRMDHLRGSRRAGRRPRPPGHLRERVPAFLAAEARAFERLIADAPEQWWTVLFPIWEEVA